MTLLAKNSKEHLSIFLVQNTTSNCKDMRQAFSVCQSAHLKPRIVSEEEVENLPHNQTTVYVLEQFKGDIFQFLTSKDCLVVGPRCLNNCIKKKISIPENDSPIFTIPMLGMVVTASKLSCAQKEELATLIGYMGGIYTDVFTLAVSHLVTDEGRSPKHQKAVEQQIPIMSSSWVKAVWEASLTRDVVATDSEFLKHRLPPFKGMHIACTNIPQETKRKLQSIIEANGGIYMASLEQNKTLILIVGEPDGKKYEHARRWGIHCLKMSWIYDSAEKGTALKWTDYAVNDRPKCSTPTSELPSFMSTEISIVPRDHESSTLNIDDTCMSVASTASTHYFKPKPSITNDYIQVLEKIENLPIRNGSLLDGCKIFFSGFQLDEVEKLKKIVNKSGGTFSMQITERLTHVVVGSFVESDSLAISKLSSNPHSVTLNWLHDSLKDEITAPVAPYITTGSKNTIQPSSSPLSSKGVHLLKSPEELPSYSSAKQRLFEVPQKEPLKEITAKQNEPTPKSKGNKEETVIENQLENNEESINNASSIDPIFQGLNFIISGFQHADPVVELIKGLGGKINSKNYRGSVNYEVVPLLHDSKIKGKQVVTSLWIDDCCENGKLLPVEYYHKPVHISNDRKPLIGNVICISGFSGKERGFLGCVASALGAVVQEKLSRKDRPDEGILAATHLLCQSLSGSKYNASVKWKIPTVDKNWLIDFLNADVQNDCEESKKDESTHDDIKMTPVNPLLKRVAAVTPSVVDSTSTTPASKSDDMKFLEMILTPSDTANKKVSSDEPNKRNLATPPPKTCTDQNYSTPEFVSRRLSSLCGKSPFHVDTPESPYGQVFLSDGEVPSPGMKKRWKNWIDNLPELYEGSPELQSFRKRRPSTPLNIVLKQLWVKFGGAQIDGIDSETGDVLPDGPYKDWAHENESILVPENSRNTPKKTEENSPASGWLKKDRSSKKNEAVMQCRSEPEEPQIDPSNTNPSPSPSKCSKYWGSSKGDPKSGDDESLPSWDFGKPFPLEKQVEKTLKPEAKESNFESKTENRTRKLEKQVEKTLEPETKESNLESKTEHRKRKLLLETTSDSSDCSKKSKGFVPETEEMAQEEDNKANPGPKLISHRRLFVMTNISPTMREKFEGFIKNLGGEMSSLPHFDPSSTHLITEKPLRSEKLLCFIASGKWVLHLSYLSHCYQSGTFLPEEDFEWGNERSKERLPHFESSMESELAKAAHRWRVLTWQERKLCSFSAFKAVIICKSENKYAQYRRILEAGGGIILPQKSIFEATHVFWDETSTLPVQKKSIVSKKIYLLKPVYLGDYLTKLPLPDPKLYTI